eukprot:TRINITY_DN2936_c0_g1_i2.p2 TRINITY_DN2936_c0_g1~~TRINITY_DN2936_c0_g1_i2.p2  ORF type:complete len:113 (+),score=17.18 TRINITY_DN2936_c0_g1_i2:82-420(+)
MCIRDRLRSKAKKWYTAILKCIIASENLIQPSENLKSLGKNSSSIKSSKEKQVDHSVQLDSGLLLDESAKTKKKLKFLSKEQLNEYIQELSLIHICRCRRIERCRSRWSPYH